MRNKYKYYFALPFLLIIFLGGLISLTNLIRLTFIFDPEKSNPNKAKFSYEIYSSNKILIDKLNAKFEVKNPEEKVPYNLKYAFIAAEDKRFLNHKGIDPYGLSRALLNNLSTISVKEGGSTITQQVARIIFLNNDLNLKRKVKELIISLLLELKYTKDEILKIYLNNIYLGSGAYGVNEASRIYFGKYINELTLSEVALIASLAPAPSIYSPFKNFDLAIKKRNEVLKLIYEEKYISTNEFQNALNEPLILYNKNNQNYLKDKLLIKYIIEETINILKKEENKKIDFPIKINSSINLSWQKQAQNIYKKIYPKELQMALVTIDSNSGLIRTMVSGRDVYSNEFNRVINAIRPLGSTFKIIPYIAVLNKGVSLNHKYNDSPTCWDHYCPKNFNDQYKGNISLIESFRISSNIVPIKIAKDLGLEEIIKLANSFGLGEYHEFQEFDSLAIGSYGDSLLNITNVYSTINNNGRFIKPSIIEKIESTNGSLIWKNKFRSKQLINREIINSLEAILEKSVSEGTGIAASISNEKIFGKTGTSDNNKDLWFIGSFKNNTTGIWLGYDDNKKTRFSSANAANLWKSYIIKIYNLKI